LAEVPARGALQKPLCFGIDFAETSDRKIVNRLFGGFDDDGLGFNGRFRAPGVWARYRTTPSTGSQATIREQSLRDRFGAGVLGDDIRIGDKSSSPIGRLPRF
jgi:hypothetical protein